VTPPPLPERTLFWRWVWSAVRPVVGWLLALLGALALFLGWYGVSGTAVPAKQVPYLISGGLTGVALVVLAAAFLATEDVRRRFANLERVERKVDALYALLTEQEDDVARARDALVAVDAGSSYHLPDCRLVTGKASARPLRAGDVASRGLTPCRLCNPPVVRAA
jgi:hypothetical protein